jgi:hypothetical protein
MPTRPPLAGPRRRRVGLGLACLALGLCAPPLAHAGRGPFRYRLVGHVGGRGAGPGRFSARGGGPAGIAVDQACGDVYISDAGARTVHRYDQNRRFLNDIGSPGTGRGQLESPIGLFVQQVVGVVNPDGPPPSCKGSGLLWVTDYAAHAVDTFTPDGRVDGMWCNNITSHEGCDISRGGPDGFDYDPHDVWVQTNPTGVNSKVYISGRLSNTISEYEADGTFIHASESTGAAYTVAVSGARVWSSFEGNGHTNLALLAVDTLGLVHPFGGDYASKPGFFQNVRGVWTQTDGTLFVVDGERVQVFSPSGRYRSTITLPHNFGGNDVAVRYDGTVYVTGDHGFGANVYSPGPTVRLFVDQTDHGNDVRLHGSVLPPHPGDRVTLQRVAANGLRTIATPILDARSRYSYTWHPPAAGRDYAGRAFFHDPHPYHADRATRLGLIHVESRLP